MSNLPEIQVNIVESHHIFSPDVETRHFTITTSIYGAKSELAVIYGRVDAILKALEESIPAKMSDFEVVDFDASYETPRLDQLHRARLKSRPKLPSRYF